MKIPAERPGHPEPTAPFQTAVISSSASREIKADSVGHSTPEGQRSAVTGLGLLQRKPLKKAPAPLRLWLRRAEFPGAVGIQAVWWCELGWFCWAGRAVANGLCSPRVPWIPAGGHGKLSSPIPALRGAKSRQGMHGELPWLSRLSARETREVIGASGKQTVCTGLLGRAGLSRDSGQQSLRAWHCVLLSSPNTQHTPPYRERFRDIRLSAEGLGFLRVWAGERSLTQPGGSVSASPSLPVVLQRALSHSQNEPSCPVRGGDPLVSRAFPSHDECISNPNVPKPVHLPALQTNKHHSCTEGEFKGGTTPGINHLLGTNAFCIPLSCQVLQGKCCRIVPATCMLQQWHSLLPAPRFVFAMCGACKCSCTSSS